MVLALQAWKPQWPPSCKESPCSVSIAHFKQKLLIFPLEAVDNLGPIRMVRRLEYAFKGAQLSIAFWPEKVAGLKLGPYVWF